MKSSDIFGKRIILPKKNWVKKATFGKNGVAGDGGNGGVHGKKPTSVDTSIINNWKSFRARMRRPILPVEQSLLNSSNAYAVRVIISSTGNFTWFIPQTTLAARGNAANGFKPTILNEVERINPEPQPTLDLNTLGQAYKTYFEGQSAQPMLAPFLGLLPGLDTSN